MRELIITIIKSSTLAYYIFGAVIDTDQINLAIVKKAREHQVTIFNTLKNNGIEIGECFINRINPLYAQAAVKWYKKLAEEGNSNAQNNYGFCLQYGIGIKKDENEAVKWFRKSADQGNSSGQNNYGDCLLYGIGIKKDENEAVKSFKIS